METPLIGLGVVIASLGLMWPLPIPFSNSIPAWAVVLLAIAMLESDGLCVLLGRLTAIATWAFIGLASVFAVGGYWIFFQPYEDRFHYSFD
jgi:hypothetical protein